MFDLRARLLSLLYWGKTRPRQWYYAKFQFSEHGQDVMLADMINNKSGFYVDVGAHHPYYLSNTYLLHQMGWRGVNIEPDPEGHRAFLRERPLDTNVLALALDEEKELDYFMYHCSALNTCCQETVEKNRTLLGVEPIRTFRLPTRRLDSLLREYVPAGIKVDLLNIDCEGSDLRILQSNDWSVFRPTWIAVEDFETLPTSSITSFLIGNGYVLTAFWHIVKIFKRME